jgi:hypothetical protein
MRAPFALATFLVLGLVNRVSAADEPDADVKMHFDDGTKAFSLGEFDRAAVEFRAAYQLRPDANFLYNIAQSYRLGNAPSKALFFYRSYLHNAPNAPNREEVEDRIQKLEAQSVAPRADPNPPPSPTKPLFADKPAPPRQPADKRRPTYKKWWLWTAVGLGVVGAVVAGAIVGAESRASWTTTGDVGPGVHAATLVRW